jgi:hypothetical protein
MIERNNRIGPAILHVSFIVITEFSAQSLASTSSSIIYV